MSAPCHCRRFERRSAHLRHQKKHLVMVVLYLVRAVVKLRCPWALDCPCRNSRSTVGSAHPDLGAGSLGSILKVCRHRFSVQRPWRQWLLPVSPEVGHWFGHWRMLSMVLFRGIVRIRRKAGQGDVGLAWTGGLLGGGGGTGAGLRISCRRRFILGENIVKPGLKTANGLGEERAPPRLFGRRRHSRSAGPLCGGETLGSCHQRGEMCPFFASQSIG